MSCRFHFIQSMNQSATRKTQFGFLSLNNKQKFEKGTETEATTGTLFEVKHLKFYHHGVERTFPLLLSTDAEGCRKYDGISLTSVTFRNLAIEIDSKT